MADTNTTKSEKADLPRIALYREWLDIKVTAPSYYTLLGLPELEDNEEAVQQAGRNVKRKVRAYQIGLYKAEALDMLQEVGQAVAVLTNPEKKRAYDRELVSRWRAAVDELYQTHCEDAGHEPSVLEAWMAACQMRGVPVARLIPRLVEFLGPRLESWPPVGELELPLPAAAWIYRDVVVLGQCLSTGSLDKRVEAVKHIQKLLGVPEGVARPIIEEVARGPQMFAPMRFVKRALIDPDAILVRIGRRIRRLGGTVGTRGKVLAALAMLLGKHKRDYERALKRLDEPPVELSPAQQAKRLARKRMRETTKRAREVREMTQQWVVSRPQILVGAALVVGFLFLIGAILIVAGGWGSDSDVAPMPDAAAAPPSPPAAIELPPVIPVTSEMLPEKAHELMKDFAMRYPVNGSATPESDTPKAGSPEPVRVPVKIPAKSPTGSDGDSPTKFFGVKAGPRNP
jgi:hypothetical protein